ncbi:MAG: Druantia anti-phage system protein DruA [Pseudomonadota bacterium]|nr:Druantia anti-phage system protein DruA [Pseudomonadota bacterium]
MKIKLSELRVHPDNDRIYDPTDLIDLENSLLQHGQMEPLAVTKTKRIISGHRRFAAMRNIGWVNCDARIVSPRSEIVSLIEHNRHRQKTVSDILNEAKFLEKELRENVGRGRYAASNRTGYKKGERITMVVELSKRLGVGTTKLKQLFSISNYEPDLIPKIDAGELSVSRAYEIVRSTHIGPKLPKTDREDEVKSLTKILKSNKFTLGEVQGILKETFPYCLELTNTNMERRSVLVEHLDYLNRFDSQELMLIRKKDELDHLEFSEKEMNECRQMLPSRGELDKFWRKASALSEVEMKVVADGLFNKHMWNICRAGIHSSEYFKSPGRSMSAFVGFNNSNGFRLLGLLSYNSDSYMMQARDDHIGWNTSQREKKREHIVNLKVCCPTQPFGYNYLGGKFLSLLAHRLIPQWEKKYNTKIVALLTSSLHEGVGQYSGMKWWKKIGSSSGRILIKPLREEWSFWRAWYRENFRERYEESMKHSSPVQSSLATIFKILDIKSREYFHNHKRGVFIRPIYRNYREFLTDYVKPDQLQRIQEDWLGWWLKKAKERRCFLEEDGKTKDETFFLKSISDIEMESWLEARGL